MVNIEDLHATDLHRQPRRPPAETEPIAMPTVPEDPRFKSVTPVTPASALSAVAVEYGQSGSEHGNSQTTAGAFRSDPGMRKIEEFGEKLFEEHAKRASSKSDPAPMGWAQEYTLSDAEMSQLKNPEWIIRDLIIRGHLMAFVSEPNGGKTTLFTHLSGEIVAAGYEVYYVNCDVAGTDAAHFIEIAKRGKWIAMLPDMKVGRSMQDVVVHLSQMNDVGGDFSKLVFIFDTLKKMTDMIQKKKVRELLQLLRSLSSKGATVIALAHTNKYPDADGKPVYEGTGDVRADVDELIYLIPQKNADGTMTVSTLPDKIRGDFAPTTFTISKERTVERAAEYVDTAAERAAEQQYELDAPDLRVILDAIESGQHKQVEVIDYCLDHHVSKRTVQRLLRDYSQRTRKQFESRRGMERNTRLYYPLDTQF